MKNFVFLVFAAGVIPIDAATIALSPASMAVSPGHVISLDLVISNLGSILVGDFDLDIGFDPSVLTLNSATPGSHLGDIASGQALDFSLGETGPGVVNIAVVSTLSFPALAAIQTPPFSLATLSFTVGPIGGATTVEIASLNALGDSTGTAISIDAVGSATLTANAAIPEPGGIGPIGLGVVLLAVQRAIRRPSRWLPRRRSPRPRP
ncbi:MAG TPA: cohesin domain-containing protein [Bryobacteraceae bacterium]|jgi:hypothetical protein